MSYVIEVDPESIRTVNDSLATAASDMNTELTNLTGELDFLMTLWTGEASAAYKTAQTDWLATMTEINSLLTRITGLLEGIAVRYEDTETNVISLCE
jgi:WXG100 family type VII secretion target